MLEQEKVLKQWQKGIFSAELDPLFHFLPGLFGAAVQMLSLEKGGRKRLL